MTSGIIDPSGDIVRDPNFPDVPTFLELYNKVHGEPLSGPAYEAYYGLMSATITTGKAIVLPSGASEEIIDAYSRAFAKVVGNPEFLDANKESLGGYQLYTGDDARALWGTVTNLSPEAYAWLTKWYDEKVGFKLPQK